MRPGFIIMSQRIKLKVASGLGRVSQAKEVQNTTLCWQGDGNCILGRARRYYVVLSSKEKYNKRCVFCKFTRPTENCDPWKTPRYAFQRDSAPDLAPSDYFHFPNLKKDIRGCHFRSNEEVMAAVEEWVRDKDPGFFSSGLMALEHRWSKCIILEGNYIEKEEIELTQK